MKNDDDKHRYDDIINMSHPTSINHPRMSALNRAAQFSPFAALSGYGDAIKESERLTDQQIDLDEHTKALLNHRLQLIQNNIEKQPQVSVTYFVPDHHKSGGAYLTHTDSVVKIDHFRQCLIMSDGTHISIYDIIDIQGLIFSGLDNEIV